MELRVQRPEFGGPKWKNTMFVFYFNFRPNGLELEKKAMAHKKTNVTDIWGGQFPAQIQTGLGRGGGEEIQIKATSSSGPISAPVKSIDTRTIIRKC